MTEPRFDRDVLTATSTCWEGNPSSTPVMWQFWCAGKGKGFEVPSKKRRSKWTKIKIHHEGQEKWWKNTWKFLNLTETSLSLLGFLFWKKIWEVFKRWNWSLLFTSDTQPWSKQKSCPKPCQQFSFQKACPPWELKRWMWGRDEHGIVFFLKNYESLCWIDTWTCFFPSFSSSNIDILVYFVWTI